ncbi:plasmid segregation protein ParM domain-containing protein [Escherichia coli]
MFQICRVRHEGLNPFNYLIDGLERFSHHSESSNSLESTVSHQYDEISRLNVHHALHASGLVLRMPPLCYFTS